MCTKREEHHCGYSSGGLKRFLEPWLLLLLHRKPTHGYELIEKLNSFDFLIEKPDPGVVYRHLRRLEMQGLISYTWDTEGPGPAKKIYKVEKEAREYLEAWNRQFRATKFMLERFLAEFDKEFSG